MDEFNYYSCSVSIELLYFRAKKKCCSRFNVSTMNFLSIFVKQLEKRNDFAQKSCVLTSLTTPRLCYRKAKENISGSSSVYIRFTKISKRECSFRFGIQRTQTQPPPWICRKRKRNMKNEACCERYYLAVEAFVLFHSASPHAPDGAPQWMR